MEASVERFARVLAELKASGVSQREVGKRLDTPAQFLTDIKAGRSSLTPAFAFRLERTFGVSHEWLLHGKGEPWLREVPKGAPPAPQPNVDIGFLPLLDTVVEGDPQSSPQWNGTQYPVFRTHVAGQSSGARRYVLRVAEANAFDPINTSDLLLIENRLDIPLESVSGKLCTIRFEGRLTLDIPVLDGKNEKCALTHVGREVNLRKKETRDGPSFKILGQCMSLIWRPFA